MGKEGLPLRVSPSRGGQASYRTICQRTALATHFKEEMNHARKSHSEIQRKPDVLLCHEHCGIVGRCRFHDEQHHTHPYLWAYPVHNLGFWEFHSLYVVWADYLPSPGHAAADAYQSHAVQHWCDEYFPAMDQYERHPGSLLGYAGWHSWRHNDRLYGLHQLYYPAAAVWHDPQCIDGQRIVVFGLWPGFPADGACILAVRRRSCPHIRRDRLGGI